MMVLLTLFMVMIIIIIMLRTKSIFWMVVVMWLIFCLISIRALLPLLIFQEIGQCFYGISTSLSPFIGIGLGRGFFVRFDFHSTISRKSPRWSSRLFPSPKWREARFNRGFITKRISWEFKIIHSFLILLWHFIRQRVFSVSGIWSFLFFYGFSPCYCMKPL